VRKSVFILVVVILLAPACCAEARWCDILGHGDSDKLTYPPIARAARISGTVLARITYGPQGDVKNVANISGPGMLAKAVSEQLKTWRLKTNSSGNDPCQSLAIIDFRLVTDDTLGGPPPQPISGSIMRLSIEAQPPPCLCDPAPTLGKKRRFLFF
jgi:hypothetical protein